MKRQTLVSVMLAFIAKGQHKHAFWLAIAVVCAVSLVTLAVIMAIAVSPVAAKALGSVGLATGLLHSLFGGGK